MIRVRKRKALIASLTVVAVLGVAAACDDDDDAASEETTEATETATEPADASPENALLANVPEVPGGTQTGQESIQEGGIHISGTVTGSPGDTAAAYQTALEKNDWTIEGSGGDPSGEAGAGLQATYSDGRYLNLQLGGDPSGTTFGNLCIWPAQPSDDNCGDDDQDQGDAPPSEEQVRGFIPDEAEQFIP